MAAADGQGGVSVEAAAEAAREREAIAAEGGVFAEPATAPVEPATGGAPHGGVVGGGPRAAGASDGYIAGSGAVGAPRGGGGVEGEGVKLADLPPSPWELRARQRDAEGVFPVCGNWGLLLTHNDKGALVKGVRNVMLILRNDERWAGRLRLNTLSVAVELDGAPVTDSDTLHARGVLERDYHLSIGDDLARQCLRLAAEFEPFDPRRAYLAGLRWDGVERLATVAARHFNTSHALYPRFFEAFFQGAVRRVLEPGCKHDTMLILQGLQGDGKSTWVAEMFGDWFTDSEIQLGSRDGALLLAGVWGVELAEVDKHLAGKTEDSVVKAMLTSRVDTFRRPYASTPESVPRSSVFVGTTNKKVFLRDHTGSRRFHVVEVQGRIPLDLVRAERDQLWAEALHRYRSGAAASYWLTPDEEASREALAESYQRPDPWGDVLRAFCANPSNVTRVSSARWGLRYAVPVNTLLGGALGLEKREWRAQGALLGETMERLGAVRDVARFKTGVGAEQVSAAAHAFLLPADWSTRDRKRASGELAPVADDEGAALDADADAFDFPS